MNEILLALDMTLDLLKSYINPTIFKGLKSDIQSIDFRLSQQQKKDKLLELYKKLVRAEIKGVKALEYYKRYDGGYSAYKTARDKVLKLKAQIKTLEEEMKWKK